MNMITVTISNWHLVDAHHPGFGCLLYDWHQPMDSLKRTKRLLEIIHRQAIIPQTAESPLNF